MHRQAVDEEVWPIGLPPMASRRLSSISVIGSFCHALGGIEAPDAERDSQTSWE